jgi:hypothetical protein
LSSGKLEGICDLAAAVFQEVGSSGKVEVQPELWTISSVTSRGVLCNHHKLLGDHDKNIAHRFSLSLSQKVIITLAYLMIKVVFRS